MNEEHRLFVFSCDLHEESQVSPWTMPGAITTGKDEARTLLKWLKTVSCKQSDFMVAFDGRSSGNRRWLEDELLVASSPSTISELSLMYRQDNSTRPGRKVFGAFPSRETGYLSGQVARVRLTTADRQDPAVAHHGGL